MPRRSELRITKRAVDGLTVSAKDTVRWDRDLAGFGVRVQPTGGKPYVVQSRGPSGPKRVTLGLHGDLSADEARKQPDTGTRRFSRCVGTMWTARPASFVFATRKRVRAWCR